MVRRVLLAFCLWGGLAAAQETPAPAPAPDFAPLEGWAADNHAEAIPALLSACRAVEPMAPAVPLGGDDRTRTNAGPLRAICTEAAALPPGDTAAARAFLERRFRPMPLGEDTLRLDMRDQHQRGGRAERVGPAIGGIAGEQLPQARIGEVFAQHLPQAFIGADRDQVADAVEADPPHERAWPGDLAAAHEALVEDAVNARRLLAEAAVSRGGGGPGEVADRLLAVQRIGVEVELAARLPRMARENARTAHRYPRA
ncbi:hypothetical protein J4558_22360 [Leptolyngbya sp. 15MV]|nr:hypothetical protein J4558_22360 [Leptolyngbya sp. 15MV]